ncbi:Maf family protein [[Clostridium] symbiosum]|uniref:Maf family protein n=1 Tax=Clostridium symbiosum TaxID=1512 RepID=UPI001D08EB03|nr:Maf family protein [[Clostridium] symbiosum]MCB6611006.1 Maf family protein [[Clostridium] symbiosum]MCB6931530.1 Maf family protein [[Clostridium] symbiosum]
MENIKVILASASPRREELLRQIGIVPEVMPSRVEEKVTKKEPDQVVMELSRQKAEEVAARLEKTQKEKFTEDRAKKAEKTEAEEGTSLTQIVVGSDTVVYADGRILGKPADYEDAANMLRTLQGGTHHVYTGVTLIAGERKKTFAVETVVDVYPMSEQEIEAYLACGESMDKAGAYGIQGRFAAHIRGIQGSYTNVMGLPAGRVYQEMKRLLEEQDD